MNDKNETLEVASKKPNLALMTQEIESAADVMRRFIDRNEIAMQYWQSRWDNQSTDGRRRSCNGEAPWPFDGASDARVRTVKQVVRDHITLFKAAFNRANVQAQSIRPFAQGQGKRSDQHTSLLRWQMNVLLKAEFQRELPLLASLKYGFGAGVVEVTWEQVRRLESHDLTIPM